MRRGYVIQECDTVADWTALGNDTTNLAVSDVGLFQTSMLEFDKANGAANSKIAGASATVTSFPARLFRETDRIVSSVYVSATTDVDYALVRLGLDSTNYFEWRYADTSLTAGRHTTISVALGDCYVGGDGWTYAEPDIASLYVAVGVAFDAEDDTLSSIRFGKIWIDKTVLTKA